MKKIGSNQNLLRIIRLLRHGSPMTRQEIGRALKLSMPTVLSAIDDLLSRKILEEAGENASTGGRRAKVFDLRKDGWYGLGIQITRKHVRLGLANLGGQVVHYERFSHPFEDAPAWYRTLGEKIEDFVSQSHVDRDGILGAGLSFPGIIDQENDMILHSHVFHIQNVSLDRFYKCIPYPLIVENDANCACYAERNNRKDSFLYISLNESVGGALMIGRNLYGGNNWTAGEVGHVILYPQGKVCYCGKKGCSDAYLNTGVLIREKENGEEENLEDFFGRLERKDPDALSIWKNYLSDLAILCSNMRMVLDMDIVLGGDVGACMDPWIHDLSILVEPLDLFSRNVDYISACTCKNHIFTTGAALKAIEHFDENMLDKTGTD